jgi:hypothetical protein
VLDHLAALVGKSLVLAEEVGGSTRYRLLETVRQYTAERLADPDQAESGLRLTAGLHLPVRRHRPGHPDTAAELRPDGSSNVLPEPLRQQRGLHHVPRRDHHHGGALGRGLPDSLDDHAVPEMTRLRLHGDSHHHPRHGTGLTGIIVM